MPRARLTRSLIWTLFAVSAAAYAADEQVTELKARHADGQTLLTWKEVRPLTTQEKLTVKEFQGLLSAAQKGGKVRYRVYRSAQPIASLDGLASLAELPTPTCWNIEFYGDPKPEQPALRYVVEEGQGPVPPGTGIYAHNPKEAGDAYYAVTVSVDGVENRTLGEPNSLKAAVKETVGSGPFVLQRVEKPKDFNYIEHPELRFYVRWEAPPRCAVESRPYDYLVALPPKLAKPAPVGIHFHCWGGSLTGGYGWWYNAEKGAILIAANQIPYDWWTGYHERLWHGKLETKEAWQQGVVRAFTHKRLLAFLDWVATKWDVDRTRVFAAGTSMGGSGSIMFGIRQSEQVAWAVSWVGVHVPSKSPTFKGSYENVYGKPEYGVKFEDGTPVWDYFNDVWYLRNHPEKEVGFITFSNGKNDSGIGWPQAVEFLKALQETKRPHLFVWGQSGHGQRATMPLEGGERVNPLDIRTDQSLPAFTACSLDSNPGNGDPKDGDPQGQVNLHLYWETKDIVDEPASWEMTVGLAPKAPGDSCTVSVTPRRGQKFKPKAGEKLKWTNTSLNDNKEIQSGEATAGEHGLVTLEKVTVAKSRNRLRISR